MKCCICHKEIDKKNSNNPMPYMTHGFCCNECNVKYVIPARTADIHKLIHDNPQIRPYAQMNSMSKQTNMIKNKKKPLVRIYLSSKKIENKTDFTDKKSISSDISCNI